MMWQTFPLALHALNRNKTRSLLTTLGVIIGVAAVIAMVSIGEGAKARVEQTFASMGTNMLIIGSGSTRTGGVMGGFGSQPTLTWDDLAAIRALPVVRAASPVSRVTAQLLSEDQNWNTSVYGVSPEYFIVRDWPVETGKSFTESDEASGNKVALLGRTTTTQLFGPYADPVGRTVRIRNVPFTVVGVLAPKGQSLFGQDQDDVVFVPVSTYRAKLQGGLQKYVPGIIMVSAVSQEATAIAERRIVDLLRDRHGIQRGQEDDFNVRNLTEIAEAQQQGMRTLSNLLAAIAAVSLLVGGIGIMNIMLVSVTERTREIGLRMAVGAKPRDILAQFLVEAFSLSLVGGLIGVATGVGTAFWLSSQFGWNLIIRPEIVAMSLGFSALVGIFFGLYPAYKASRLDPIEALRFE
jgi:putative ABC transport system permease protein